jgi:phage shock protein PspC (stress-responsive transcriptional regulator)
MNRVTIVNLAGRALHVEDAGVEAIDGWMDAARRTLAGDPDRDELLADFEEAIADRCAVYAPGATDVVTAAQVEDVLTALGTVEPADVMSAVPATSEGGEAEGAGAGADGGAGGGGGEEGDGGAGFVEDGDLEGARGDGDVGGARGAGDEASEGAGGEFVEGEFVGGDGGASGVSGGESAESASGAERSRSRRLYRLTGEGERKIAGVVAGIASYLNVDVTVARLVAIVFAVASFGATLLVYVVLALVLPAAELPDERMAAQGYGDTAKEVMSRARANATPALSSVGAVLRAGVGAISTIVTWVLMLALSAVLIAGSVAVAAVFVDPEPLATAFDDGTSTWVIAVWVSSGFWLAAGVLIVLAALMRRLASPTRSRVLSAAVGAMGLVMVTVATVTVVAIPMASSAQMRSLTDGEGTLEIFEETWCLTQRYGFERDIEDCDARSSELGIGRVWVLGGGSLEDGALEVAELQMLAARERLAELDLRLELRLDGVLGR